MLVVVLVDGLVVAPVLPPVVEAVVGPLPAG